MGKKENKEENGKMKIRKKDKKEQKGRKTI